MGLVFVHLWNTELGKKGQSCVAYPCLCARYCPHSMFISAWMFLSLAKGESYLLCLNGMSLGLPLSFLVLNQIDLVRLRKNCFVVLIAYFLILSQFLKYLCLLFLKNQAFPHTCICECFIQRHIQQHSCGPSVLHFSDQSVKVTWL